MLVVFLHASLFLLCLDHKLEEVRPRLEDNYKEVHRSSEQARYSRYLVYNTHHTLSSVINMTIVYINLCNLCKLNMPVIQVQMGIIQVSIIQARIYPSYHKFEWYHTSQYTIIQVHVSNIQVTVICLLYKSIFPI